MRGATFTLLATCFSCLLLVGLPPDVHAQDCQCTVSQVVANTVTPCDKVIGQVINVATTTELYNAINDINASGGNKTVLLADGTYDIASPGWYPYITASNVVFRSASGNRDAVILTGTGMKSVSPGVENVLYFVGDNNTIADLTIRDAGNHGIAVEGDSLLVHNVRIQDTYEQMIKGTAGGDGADHGRVQCSLFEYTAGIGPQFYIGGLDIHKGDQWTVRDNVFIDIASPSGSLAEHAVHFWNNGSENTVERNMIINCDRGIGFGLGSSPNTGGMIRNNMIYNDGMHPFHDVGIGLETSPGTKVFNNTVYIQYPNAIEYRFPETMGVDIINNLTNKPIKARDGAVANLITNETNAWESWFVDAPSGNLRLAGNFPVVVDQGAYIFPMLVDDIDQTTRPEGDEYDIGAHEFLQSSSQESAPGRDVVVRLFPNPVRTSLSIQADLADPVSVHILNALGQEIFSLHQVDLSPGLQVDTRAWPAGVYLGQIRTGDQRIMRTIVVE
ncbi:MAG: T9SS type A sorting domain-containing protein [Lewinellaceae bacterium]|nr:T9SS type A sorting domain-containing protein [Saprospiraceae bacterium]MCB9313449.1 T9SS type A sorting domain-containing protein [Lewinellaceae bacterium]